MLHTEGVDPLDTPGHSYAGHSPTADQNSQVVGSDVLIWTDGTAPMDLSLSFPPRDDPLANRDSYVVHPKFRVACAAGTLTVNISNITDTVRSQMTVQELAALGVGLALVALRREQPLLGRLQPLGRLDLGHPRDAREVLAQLGGHLSGGGWHVGDDRILI